MSIENIHVIFTCSFLIEYRDEKTEKRKNNDLNIYIYIIHRG